MMSIAEQPTGVVEAVEPSRGFPLSESSDLRTEIHIRRSGSCHESANCGQECDFVVLLPATGKLVVEREGNRLVVRFLNGGPRGEVLLPLIEEQMTGLSPTSLAALGLTGREVEVLMGVARSKTDREIANILAVSPRTVQKHLEHVFHKLGVSTRSSAARRALELAQKHGRG